MEVFTEDLCILLFLKNPGGHRDFWGRIHEISLKCGYLFKLVIGSMSIH